MFCLGQVFSRSYAFVVEFSNDQTFIRGDILGTLKSLL